MIYLFNFCDIHWAWPWILPFLTGLGLGWVTWGKYKRKTEDLKKQLSDLNQSHISLKNDIFQLQKSQLEKDKEYAGMKNQLRLYMEGKAGKSVKLEPRQNTHIHKSSDEKTDNADSAGHDRRKWTAAIGSGQLQIIEGIGPRMEQVLKENNISHFADLSRSSAAELRLILDKYGEKYRMINPETWPSQSSLAVEQKWDDLIALQLSLGSEKKESHSTNPQESKLYKWLTKAKILQRWAKNDLKAIEGIGPKIEKLLHEAGINTWKILSGTPESTLKDILTHAGSRFSLADPATWSRQATMADEGLWDELEDYQNSLIAGKQK